MLRPGRLDVLISVTPPDRRSVEALVRREAGPGLDYEEDLHEVGLELAGAMPAVIVQVVQRAKRAAQRRVRTSAGLKFGDTINPKVVSADLLIAARSMKTHIDRLKPVVSDERTPIEKAADTLAGALVKQGEIDLTILREAQEGYTTPPPGIKPKARTNHSVVGAKAGAEVTGSGPETE
jgi:SpoVK/Ycf46/Vps4 family AAA+-type ATPase